MKTGQKLGTVGFLLMTALVVAPWVSSQGTTSAIESRGDGFQERKLDEAFKRAVRSARISLSQAASVAEKHFKGKAFEAHFQFLPTTGSDRSGGSQSGNASVTEAGPLYVQVSLLVGDKVVVVQVNDSGEVVSPRESAEDDGESNG